MGQQTGPMLLTVAGTVAGSIIGGPIGGAIGGMAGGLIGGLIFNRSTKPLIPDMQWAGSSYGKPIPIVYGQVRLAGTFIWEDEITTKGGTGKGMSTGTTTSMRRDAALAFCVGPAKLLKVWTDGNLFLDNTVANQGEIAKYQIGLRWYDGSDSQLPDPLIQSWVSAHVLPGDSCPAYRDLAYLVMESVELGQFGGRFPNVTAVVATDVTETIIYRQLTRWTDDVSTDTSIRSIGVSVGMGIAVDWIRGVVYQQSQDGTIRVFDIASGGQIQGKTAAQLGTPAFFSQDVFAANIMACVQGGNLYLTTGRGFFAGNGAPYYVLTIDPNTLTIVHAVGIASGFESVIKRMVAFSIAGPTGSVELLAGAWFSGGGGFVLDPKSGVVSGALVFPFDQATSQFDIVIGKQDTTAGTVDVWFLSASFFDSTRGIYLSRAVVTAANVSDLAATFAQVATLTAADFGSSPVTVWSPVVSGVYDPSDDTLIISCNDYTNSIKWSATSGVVWVAPGMGGPVDGGNPKTYWNVDRGMYADVMSTSQIGVVSTSDGSFVTLSGVQHVPTPTYGYDSYSNAIVFSENQFGDLTHPGNPNNIWVAYLQRQVAGEVPVAGIIADICARAGMTTDQVDVTQVTATTIGYAITEAKSAGACLSDLCSTYQIDMVESDYVLHFIPRGQAAVATITQDDLASLTSGDPSQFWQVKRAPQQELPLQLNVRYVDPVLDFQPGAAYAKRTALPVPTQWSKRVKIVDLPVVATNDEARHIAEAWLYTLWAERDTYDTMTGWKYLWLDPTDNVTVNLANGDSYTSRIESVDMGADFTMKLALASEDATTYTPSTSPAASVSFTPQTVTPTPFADLLLFNAPLLLDSDDTGGTSARIYYAGAPNGAMPSGGFATLYQSTDGTTWSVYDTLAGFAAWGHATTTLGDTVSKFATDYVNTLTVTFASGSALPTSASYLDLMNGANAAMVGSEVVQFGTATSNADGTVTLSTLLRGRRGTEWATGTHAPGEMVVLLVAGQLGATKLPLAELGQTEYWRLVPSGRFLDQVSTDSFIHRGYDLKPYAPVDLDCAASGADLVLNWTRRTRVGGLLLDGTDTVQLGESSESYDVYLLAVPYAAAANNWGVPSTGVVRSYLGVTTPSVTYTAEQMAADGFPASATDPSFASVVLLCHFDGANGATTFTDASNSAHSLVANAVTVSTTAKFGSGAGSFATSGSIAVNGSVTDFNFAEGPFTIEGWAYFTAAPGSANLVMQWGGTANLGWFLGLASGQLGFGYSTTGADSVFVAAAYTPAVNTWIHIAADRDANGVLRVYANGAVIASATVPASFYPSTQTPVLGNGVPGVLDEVRVSKGLARYAGAFTAPTAAFAESGKLHVLVFQNSVTVGHGWPGFDDLVTS